MALLPEDCRKWQMHHACLTTEVLVRIAQSGLLEIRPYRFEIRMDREKSRSIALPAHAPHAFHRPFGCCAVQSPKRLVVKDDIEKRAMNVHATVVVIDKA